MAAMLPTNPHEFFHYTPCDEKEPPTAVRHAIAKGLAAKKSPRKPPPAEFS
jgi:hypothetical protein